MGPVARLGEFMVFLCGFLKEPVKVSTGFQSSRFMAKNFERTLDYLTLTDGCVVELGPGTGVLTEKIVARLGGSTRLVCVELEQMYADHLRRKFAHDDRVSVVVDRAENLATQLERLGVDKVTSIVSAVPLSCRNNQSLVRTIRECLKDGGRMVQMGWVKRGYFERERFRYLGRVFTFLNFPPEMLHVCEKLASRPDRSPQAPVH